MYFNLFKKSFKINSRSFNTCSFSGYLFNKFANFFIPIFLILKLKANTITLVNFFVGFICIFFLFVENFFSSYSFFLYFLNKILDHCDGGLARFYKKKTFFGKLIDSISDILFASFFNLALTIIFYLQTHNYYILVLGSVSSIFICFDTFIYDKFSSLVRWCNQENKNKFSPYIKKIKNPRLFFFFEDFVFLAVILLFSFKNNLDYSQKILITIFSLHIISFYFNMNRHILLGYKFLNYNKK
jgi:phosphatidylglycerophosphate synthase